jgi:hypothetical protein
MQNGELIEQDGSMILSSSDDIIALAENAAKRIEAVKKIKTLALAVTNNQDWQDEGGKPYLWVSGAEKVARLFNISWRIGDPEVEDHEDGHFTFTYQGNFGIGGKEIQAIGTRSSRDPFFSKARGAEVDPSQISRGNVKKAAYTNCIGNGVTRLLGIRNMTWDELAKAGISREKSGAVDRSGNKIPRTPKYGPSPDIPLTECSVEDLQFYADSLDKALTIDEKQAILPNDTAEEKRKKEKHNQAVEKKVKFKGMNEKLLEAIIATLETRAAKEANTEAEPAEAKG